VKARQLGRTLLLLGPTLAMMDSETHEAFLAEWSSGTMTAAEIVARIGTYAGDVYGKQLADLVRYAHRYYPLDGQGPVHTAVHAHFGNGNGTTVGQVRRID
jgi:hypothetical protein